MQHHQHVPAVVVGGGAAGIAVVANFLERLEGSKVAWVDPEFKGGRINRKYREVPSNTRVTRFKAYAQAWEPFREIIKTASTPNAMTRLEDLDDQKTCSLSYAGDLLQLLSDGLAKNERVLRRKGMVTEASWDEQKSVWSFTIQHGDCCHGIEKLTTSLLVYCTGSSPTTVSLPTPPSKTPELLDLDVALKPSALAKFLPLDQGMTVGIIGASHSAILVLMNLVKLAQRTHPNLKVRWFARSANLRYAVHHEDWILYDNTGLKGEAAQFAKEQLEEENLLKSEAGQIITRIDCSGGAEQEKTAMLCQLPSCQYVVQAVGYTNEQLPAMKEDIKFDHKTSGFTDAKTRRTLKGLYGAGIAFPELVVDRAGNQEYAVGFFKFLNFLNKVMPEWIEKTYA